MAGIQSSGRITEQNIQSGANNAATRDKQGLINEYFSPDTSPERRALLAPLVGANASSTEKFKPVTLTDENGEKAYSFNPNTGEYTLSGMQNNSTASNKKTVSKEQWLTDAQKANPQATPEQLLEQYNIKKGK